MRGGGEGEGGERKREGRLQERDDLLDRLEIAELQLKDRITKGEEANILNVSIYFLILMSMILTEYFRSNLRISVNSIRKQLEC